MDPLDPMGCVASGGLDSNLSRPASLLIQQHRLQLECPTLKVEQIRTVKQLASGCPAKGAPGMLLRLNPATGEARMYVQIIPHMTFI